MAIRNIQTLSILVLLLVLQSCSTIRSGHRVNRQLSKCYQMVLKPKGKAELIKCGEIVWTEEGRWSKKGDTITVTFRNFEDCRVFIKKGRKFYRIHANKQSNEKDRYVKLAK